MCFSLGVLGLQWLRFIDVGPIGLKVSSSHESASDAKVSDGTMTFEESGVSMESQSVPTI